MCLLLMAATPTPGWFLHRATWASGIFLQKQAWKTLVDDEFGRYASGQQVHRKKFRHIARAKQTMFAAQRCSSMNFQMAITIQRCFMDPPMANLFLIGLAPKIRNTNMFHLCNCHCSMMAFWDTKRQHYITLRLKLRWRDISSFSVAKTNRSSISP